MSLKSQTLVYGLHYCYYSLFLFALTNNHFYYCCGASVASVAAVHNLKYIKDRYENLRFCMGFSLAISGP